MMTIIDPSARRPRLAGLALAWLAVTPAAAQLPAQSALTPPMGWNPWNAFRTEVDEDKVMAVARKLVASGLMDAGYRYVNLDDGWWLRRRADDGIDVRTSMLPSAALADGSTSLRPFVDRLHALGLRAGIYTDIGRNACSQAWDAASPNLPAGSQAEREVGTYGHQTADMRLLLADWGFDYVKVDACGLADYAPDKRYVRDGTYRALGPLIVRGQPARSDTAQVESLYAGLARALASARPQGDAVLSICAWGEAGVADWAGRYANTWRTSPDIRPTWASMLRNFDSAAARPLYARPGHWNDPDMLEVGLGEFDAAHPVEARAHMALWAIIGAPLILGADLTHAPQSVFDIVGNREVIAIDQDPAGNQGVTVARDGDTQVIVKALAQPGSKAVALVNRGAVARRVALPLARLGFAQDVPVSVRDVWSGKQRAVDGAVDGTSIAVDLAPHETALLVVAGAPRRDGVVPLSAMPARVRVLLDGAAALPVALRKTWVPVQAAAAPSGASLVLDGKPVGDGIGALANSRIAVQLDGAYRSFHARAGVMAAPALGTPPGDITWRIYADGKLLFERSASTTLAIDVPVPGARMLELAAASASGAPAVIVWGDAALGR